MTKARLDQLNEMRCCLDRLAEITDALNKPIVDITIATHIAGDMLDEEMSVKAFPDFMQAFSNFIRTYYNKLQEEFHKA